MKTEDAQAARKLHNKPSVLGFASDRYSTNRSNDCLWPGTPIRMGQSTSALPRYFRRLLVPLLLARHRPQCRDSAPCSRSLCGLTRVVRHEDSPCACKSVSPWCDAANGCHRGLDQVRCWRSNPTGAGHIAVSSGIGLASSAKQRLASLSA